MERRKYYVDMQAREISEVKYENNHHYTIYATETEVAELRRLFQRVTESDQASFWRSYIPFEPYHRDLANDLYDAAFSDALALVYRLGDDQTKMYIETTVVLRKDI